MNWREVLISLFLLLAALLLWQKLSSDEQLAIPTSPSNTELPGYYLQGTELVRFNSSGVPLYTINADRIEENLADKSLKLSKLNIVYGTTEQDQWQISADQAILPENRKTIKFNGNVLAKQLNNSSNASFRSDTLNYDIEKEILTTKDRVTAHQGVQRISATGMTLNIKNERVKLHSNVKIRLQFP